MHIQRKLCDNNFGGVLRFLKHTTFNIHNILRKSNFISDAVLVFLIAELT